LLCLPLSLNVSLIFSVCLSVCRRSLSPTDPETRVSCSSCPCFPRHPGDTSVF
jgi:hypothetical protein